MDWADKKAQEIAEWKQNGLETRAVLREEFEARLSQALRDAYEKGVSKQFSSEDWIQESIKRGLIEISDR
jgi:hypothetical protein